MNDMMMMITNSVIPDDCHIFSQRAAFPSSPNTCNLDNYDDGDNFDDYDEYAYELVVRMGIILYLQTLLTSQGQGLICYPEVHKGHNHHRQILIVVTGDSRCWVQGQQWPGIPPQKQNPPLLSPSSISSPPQSPPPPPPSQNKTPLR